jgi:hypothetical protein
MPHGATIRNRPSGLAAGNGDYGAVREPELRT